MSRGLARGGRKSDRRHGLCLVFAADFHDLSDFDIVSEFDYYREYFAIDTIGVKIRESDYVLDLVGGVCAKRDELDELIAQNAESWDISRISKMDLAIMRLAVYEILYIKNIAHTVAINEAVEIAKEFSTEESSKFVNGILGKIVRTRKGGSHGDSGI
jgi:N utilization substance protein B